MKTRDRLIHAAERIHQREGLEAVSMRRLAEEVGLTPMAAYRHFRDKDALLDALVDAGLARWEQYLAVAASAATPLERVRSALTAYVGFALGEPHAFQLTYLVTRRRDDVPPAPLRMTASPAYAAIVDAARDAIASGEMRAGDPAEHVGLAWASVHGLIVLHRGGRFGFDDAKFRAAAGRTIDSLLQLLAPNATR